MRPLLFASVMAIVMACGESRAGWGPAGCGPVGLPIVILQTPKAEPKIETREQPKDNFGIDLDKLRAETRDASYTIKGQPVTRAEMVLALTQGGLADDTHKLRVTVIGGESDRKAVVNDLAASTELAPYRDAMLVQAYAPDHWAVRDAGFVTTGKPTIYLQRSDGKVLHRQDSYSGGAAQLAEAIRRVRPDYDPKKDPDARKPGGGDGSDLWSLVKWCVIGLACLVGIPIALLVFGLCCYGAYRVFRWAVASSWSAVRAAATKIAHPPESQS